MIGYLNTGHLLTTEAIKRLSEDAVFVRKVPDTVRLINGIPMEKFIKTANFISEEIKPRLNYGAYLINHKATIFKEGWKLGLPPGQLLLHDYSKFKPGLYGPYAKYFFGNPPKQNYDAWRVQVEKHYNSEKHHLDKIGLDKPVKYELESILDWYSVYKNTGGTLTFLEWWDAHKQGFLLSGKLSQAAFNNMESRIKNASIFRQF